MKRRLVALSLLACTLASCDVAASQVPQPVGPLRVADAAGKSLGDVTDLQGNQYAWSVMKIGDWRFRLWVHRDRLKSEGANAIYFQSADCTGAPFIYGSPDNRFFDLVEIIGDRMSVYSPPPGALFAPRTMRSNLDSDGVCTAPGPSTFVNAPAIRLLDLRDHFTPPFSLLETAPSPPASVPTVGWPGLASIAIALAALGVFASRRARARGRRTTTC